MSTSYRIAGQGARLTERTLRRIVEEAGGTVEDRSDPSPFSGPWRELAAVLDGNYVWFQCSPHGTCNTFERYGANDADPLVDLLEDHGFSVLSEHDEGFFR